MPIYRVAVFDDEGNSVPDFSVRHRKGCYKGCAAKDDSSATEEDGATDKIFVQDLGHRISWDAQNGFLGGSIGSGEVDMAGRVLVTINLQRAPVQQTGGAGSTGGHGSHLCRAACSTKDSPCVRRVVHGRRCYQHRIA